MHAGTQEVIPHAAKRCACGIAACALLSVSCIASSLKSAPTPTGLVGQPSSLRVSSQQGSGGTPAGLPQPDPDHDSPAIEDNWDDEEWEEADDGGRSFLYKELVLSGAYSPQGFVGVPLDDRSEDHFELSPRPPGNYLGLELIRTFTPSSRINKELLPDWLPLTAIDLHPRLLFDRLEESDDLDQVEFAPQDFWLRFNPGNMDRVSLRVGQFVLPYGVNPILAPRQQFILPIEALDLGLKWDWGVGIKGPAGEFDWELAATIGSGEALHSPHFFGDSDRTSYLITGRIGTPTYWDFQYGVSFLYGDLPVIRGARRFSDEAISRWRVGLDAFYKHGTYLMMGAQLTYGQDGFSGDEEFVAITNGETADVLGYRTWIDWVIPSFTDVRLGAQFESVVRDLSTSHSDDTAAIFEVAYSLTTSTTLRLDYRLELNRSTGDEHDAVFLTFIYYGL